MEVTGIDDTIRAVATGIARTGIAAAATPRVRYGTVVGFIGGHDTATPLATVAMDGDPPGATPATIPVVTGGVAPGDRVPVLYDPPHGAYVIGSTNAARGATGLEVPYSYSGLFVVEDPVVLSPPWGTRTDRYLEGFLGVAEQEANTGTVTVYIDGTEATTIEWSDGSRFVYVDHPALFAGMDTYLQMAITDVDSGDVVVDPGKFTIIAYFR